MFDTSTLQRGKYFSFNFYREKHALLKFEAHILHDEKKVHMERTLWFMHWNWLHSHLL